MKEITVYQNCTIKKLLEKDYMLPFYTVDKLIKDKAIKLNGERVRENIEIKKGDKLTVFYDFSSPKLDVIFENEQIIIVNKSKNILSQGNNSVEEILKENNPNIRACHRLDRNTDGLLILAKSTEVEKEVCEMLKCGKIQKTYHAKVFGNPKSSATLNDYLFKDAKNSKVYITKDYKKGSKQIITSYKFIERQSEISLLEVKIQTGRTHQIRAHLAYHNLPIVGDEKYGNISLNKKYEKNIQELTEFSISFPKLEESGLLHCLSERKFEITK